jgi:hypothetical protein
MCLDGTVTLILSLKCIREFVCYFCELTSRNGLVIFYFNFSDSCDLTGAKM